MNQLVENQFRSEPNAVAVKNVGAGQVEQRQIAEAQAMLLMAQRFPRNQVAAMDKVLNAFTRPSLAEVAEYQYAKGGSDISGPSIRAAEAIAQQWGNIEFGFRELARGVDQDGVGFSEVEAYAMDYEARTRKPLQFIVPHWRDKKNGGGYALKEEREIYELVANMAQRRVRACILSIIPGDVTEQAMKQATLTLKTTADTSPEAMVKMVEAFEAFGVTKEHIEARIQRRIEAIQPAQVVSLKRVYVSLRDEMSVPADWFEMGEDGGAGVAKKADTGPTPYPEEKFAKELPKWRKLIADGKKSADDIIALASSKHILSDAQKAGISAPAEQSQQPAQGDGDIQAVTFAYVADLLNKAKTVEALDEAADLVGSVTDIEQRKELSDLFKQRKAGLQA